MPDNIYIATLLNPVDHKPYGIVWNPDVSKCYVVTPSQGKGKGKVWGEGYFEKDENDNYAVPWRASGCYRSHTPGGVKEKGTGLGLMLYSGLALTAAYASELATREREELGFSGDTKPCISSSETDRSAAADKWWAAQVRRGLAEEFDMDEGGEQECETDSFDVDVDQEDLGIDQESVERRAAKRHDFDEISEYSVSGSATVEYTYCSTRSMTGEKLTAESVDDAGIILHVNERIGDYHNNLPELKLMLEIDLSDIEDFGFLQLLEDAFVFNYGDAGAAAFQKFLKRVPFWKRHAEEGKERKAGGYREYVRTNPEHSRAWLAAYGDLIRAELEAEAEEAKTKKNPPKQLTAEQARDLAWIRSHADLEGWVELSGPVFRRMEPVWNLRELGLIETRGESRDVVKKCRVRGRMVPQTFRLVTIFARAL